MIAQTVTAPTSARPSLVIAEALVERQSPCEIVDRATTLGFPQQLTEVMVVVCGATAVDLPASCEGTPSSPTLT